MVKHRSERLIVQPTPGRPVPQGEFRIAGTTRRASRLAASLAGPPRSALPSALILGELNFPCIPTRDVTDFAGLFREPLSSPSA